MLINVWDTRTFECDITITNRAGAAVPIDTDGTPDNVRVKIGRSGNAPLLDIESNGAGNSTITIKSQGTFPGEFTLRLHQNDIANTLYPGVFDIEVSLVDDSDGEVIKHAEMGTLVVHKNLGGEIDL